MGTPYNNGYTFEQAYRAITAPSLATRFPVALLDNKNRFIRWLNTIKSASGSISNDTSRDIIRQWSQSLYEPYDVTIDPFFHRFMPYVWVKMPAPSATGDGDPYLKYPQGVFIASDFKRTRLSNRARLITISGDDLTAILINGIATQFAALPAASYGAAFTALATAARIEQTNIDSSFSAINPSVGKQWDRGEPYGKIYKALCKDVVAEWFFDERGALVVRKWIDPAVRPLDFAYLPDDRSIVYAERESNEGSGLLTPNFVFGTVSRQNAGVSFYAEARNDNENSKYSIPRRNFVIPYKMQLADAPNEPTFQEQVDRKLAELSYSAKVGTLKGGLVPYLSPISLISARTDDGMVTLGDFETANNFEGWATSNISAARVANGVLRGAASNADPQIVKSLPDTIGRSLDGQVYRFIRITMRILGGGAEFVRVYFSTEAEGFDGSKVISMRVRADAQFHEHNFDGWASGLRWKGSRIKEIRIDPAETANRVFEIARVEILKNENRYFATQYKYNLQANAQIDFTGLQNIEATD